MSTKIALGTTAVETAIPTDRTARPKLGSARAWTVWAIATVFVVWLFNAQTGWAILSPTAGEDLNLSVSQIGFIGTTYTWAFALAQLFSGALLDRLGSRKVLIPAIALVAVGVLLFATAQNFGMLMLSQVVLAIGASAGFVGAGYVGGVWFGMAKFGLMFGLVQVVAALSSGFGQAGFNFALDSLTWRELLYGFVGFGVVLLIAAIAFVRNPEAPDTTGMTPGTFIKDVTHNLASVFKNRQVLLISLAGSVTFGIQLALGVVWLPRLVESHGIATSSANLTSAALWIGLAIGSVFINNVTDLLKSRKIPMIVSTAIMIASLAGLTFLPINALAAQALALTFGIANAGHMLAFTMGGDNVPPRLIGTTSSVVNGAMFIMGGILMSLPGSMLAGTQETLADFQKPMTVFLALLVASFVLTFVIRESHPEKRG